MELLLLSNSTMPGEAFFHWPLEHVRAFLQGRKRVAFAAHAAPEAQRDAYLAKVAEVFGPLGVEMVPLHAEGDPVTALRHAEAVAVGGGNSFLLLRDLYRAGLVRAITERVKKGLPYLGWSAGSNVACPTIMTTNDMPIVEPPTLRGMHLVPFQINPHYTEATIPGHGGESRDQRIAEYLALNPAMAVAGLREGSLLHVHDGQVQLHGGDMKVFRAAGQPVDVPAGSLLRGDLQVAG
ncbi:MAG: dipeptidase PepE [Flavobacteriales bacterium]|jgi:dipeptidase E|nr:dipeptidase PepE [Flavobacteriales bacterium]